MFDTKLPLQQQKLMKRRLKNDFENDFCQLRHQLHKPTWLNYIVLSDFFVNCVFQVKFIGKLLKKEILVRKIFESWKLSSGKGHKKYPSFEFYI